MLHIQIKTLEKKHVIFEFLIHQYANFVKNNNIEPLDRVKLILLVYI